MPVKGEYARVQRHSKGYRMQFYPEHPRANNHGYVFSHLLIAEKALGYPVPTSVEVHHFDEQVTNNGPGNLVICEGGAYHKLLHLRMNAYRATGNPNARSCVLCHQWDTPENPDFVQRANGQWRHRACHREYMRQSYARR